MLAVLLLGIYQWEIKIYSYRKNCIRVFIAVVFKKPDIRNNPNVHGKWINKFLYNGILLINKKEQTTNLSNHTGESQKQFE